MAGPKEKRHALVDPDLMREIRRDLPNKRLDQQRQMKHFVVPGGRRLTEYEVLTIYAQQGTDWASGGIELGDSMQKWPGGRPTYAPETTELKTTDWWRFRDPEGRWFFPYIKGKAEEGRINQRFMLGYSADGALRMIEPHWLDEVLGKYFAAFLFNEYGLFNAHGSSVHDCLSDVVRVFLSNIAFDKADAAQLIQTQRVFVHKMVPTLPVELDVPREVWCTSPVFRGAKRAVEALWEDTFDHLEVIWAIHAVYEPLFGQYVRREFFQRISPRFGDTLTPWFMAQSVGFHHYAAAGVRALFFEALGADPEFGDLNRRWLHVWTNKWLPRVVEALRDFLGVYQVIGAPSAGYDGTGIRGSVERVVGDWADDFAGPMSLKVDVPSIVARVLGEGEVS